MKHIALIGSTGSIGKQTLDVISAHKDLFCVESLVAYQNRKLVETQAKEFGAKYFATVLEDGENCLVEAVKNCDIAVIATRGIVALDCVMYCLENNIDLAIANKEVIVCGGKLIFERAKTSKSKILPVDSEHSAIFQCLNNSPNKPKRLILTASGGAFWNLPKSELKNVTFEQALNHPNWNMGQKITVDSATMMNKTFEVIEASWLFDMPIQNIEIVVHRQSIIHSMVEFDDNSVLAQLSNPDMRLPIQYALTYPNRLDCKTTQLDFKKLSSLTFEKPDFERFPCVNLAYEISKLHPLIPTVLNAANDVCVEQFLAKKLRFVEFYSILSGVIAYFDKNIKDFPLNIEQIKAVDSQTRKFTKNFIMENKIDIN